MIDELVSQISGISHGVSESFMQLYKFWLMAINL